MRGDGRVLRVKDSRFLYISYYHRGREVRESSAALIREAEATKGRHLTPEEGLAVATKFLRRRVREVANERDAIRPFLGPQNERVTVNELLDDLEAEYRRGGKRRIPREVDAPMRSHLKRLRSHFGEMRAIAVGKRQLDEFIRLMLNKHKANATINRSTELLGQAFSIAVSSDPPKVLRPLTIPKLDESANVRKGKFSESETKQVYASLPAYLVDLAEWNYETGGRSGESRKLWWDYLEKGGIRVPPPITKIRVGRLIALTPKMEEILVRRRRARLPNCPLIFHHDGRAIVDYRKAWRSACLINGFGKIYCRDCRDKEGNYACVLDATNVCPRCGRKWKRDRAKYIGRYMHDFRRSAAYEMKKAGVPTEDAKRVTGHLTDSMYNRYADLFSDDEIRTAQQDAQKKRHQWREAEAERSTEGPGAGSLEPPRGRMQ